MARRVRSGDMDTPSQTLLIVGACGAVVAAGFGALAGTGLRVPPRLSEPDQRVVVATQEVFADGPPAYPSWAPEPLYPRAEPDPLTEFNAAWDDAMSDSRREARPVVFRPPSDLPPAYEVRIQGDGQGSRRRDDPQPVDNRPSSGGRYVYGAPPVPPRPVVMNDGGKPDS